MANVLWQPTSRTVIPRAEDAGPAVPSIEYVKMQEDWHLLIALWGGTKSMRKAGETYLPREAGESREAYEARKGRTFLYPAFKNTIQRLAGSAFLKNVVVENVPAELEYLEHFFDSEGRSITEVAYDLMVDQLRFGKAHGLMDYPESTHNLTLADERALKIRPYFTRIDPRDLIGWRSRRVGGADILDQIRIQEIIVEPYDDFGEIEVFRVRVFYPDRVDMYRTSNEDGVVFDYSIPFTLGHIPLVTAYGEKTGFLTAKSPLEDLGWLNLRHWQSTSDQNNVLHVSRVPIFFAKGFAEGELNAVTFGAHRGISTSSENADISYVEHTGAAIGAGEDDLSRLEEQMYRAGADLMVSKSVARQTASARQTDRTESMSVVQTIIDSLERCLENAYELAGQWIGVDASDVKVRIGEEFALNDPNPTDSLLKLNLSDEDLRRELVRRGIITDMVSSVRPSVEQNQTPVAPNNNNLDTPENEGS